MALPVATLLALILVGRGVLPIAASWAASFVILGVGGAVVVAALVQLPLQVALAVWVRRNAASAGPAERGADAERLYWLAVCVGLKSQKRLQRQL